eukprot:140484-Amphidinium_carterae.1
MMHLSSWTGHSHSGLLLPRSPHARPSLELQALSCHAPLRAMKAHSSMHNTDITIIGVVAVVVLLCCSSRTPQNPQINKGPQMDKKWIFGPIHLGEPILEQEMLRSMDQVLTTGSFS